jgi:methionine-rich copper-binding protein CopC
MVSHRINRTALVLTGVAVLGARAAQAHAFLDHANPAVGSSLPAAPANVSMWFTQQLEPAFTSAVVTNQSGDRVDTGSARVDASDPTELSVPLKPLPPGTYTVAWRALSVDTHTTTGHFTFTVAGK